MQNTQRNSFKAKNISVSLLLSLPRLYVRLSVLSCFSLPLQNRIKYSQDKDDPTRKDRNTSMDTT